MCKSNKRDDKIYRNQKRRNCSIYLIEHDAITKIVKYDVRAYESPNTVSQSSEAYGDILTGNHAASATISVPIGKQPYYGTADYVLRYVTIVAWDDYGFSYAFGWGASYTIASDVWTFTGGTETRFYNDGTGTYKSAVLQLYASTSTTNHTNVCNIFSTKRKTS